MKIIRLVFLISQYSIISSSPLKAQDEKTEWYKVRWETVEAAKNNNNPSSIKKLGDIVRGMGRSKDTFSPEASELYTEARKTLLSIPGHAEYYGNEIRRITNEQIAGTSQDHSSQRGWYYETLAQLPSPETVKVLGELLLDERDPWKSQDWGDGGRPWSNSTHAVMILNQLGIKNAPVHRKDKGFEEPDIKTWQLWFEQVKAGTKTFSFVGNPQEYSLKGPVATPAAATRDRRDGGTVTANSAPSTAPVLHWPLIATIAACGVLIVGVWHAFKNRRRASSR